VRHTSGQTAADHGRLGLATHIAPSLLYIGSDGGSLINADVSGDTGLGIGSDLRKMLSIRAQSTRIYNLLVRCSLTKTPFDLPVSFSADFNTRLFKRQY
jgi:hypothetical protein